jgi:trypsin
MLIRLLALTLLLAGLGPSPVLLSRGVSAAPVETEVVGGKKARPGTNPFLVAVQFDTSVGRSQCTGTLLDATHVLTAAHCVTDGVRPYTNLVVFYGDVKLSQARTVAVTTATPHPGYDPNRIRNDVAVLKLAAPVTGPNIGFVRLPPIGGNATEKTGRTVIVAGWGATFQNGGAVNDLREATLKIVSAAECKAMWSLAGIVIAPSQICAWQRGHDACFGDSGGPLFARTANSAVQIGVTSFGYGCATVMPGGYTRLSNPGIGNFVRAQKAQ